MSLYVVRVELVGGKFAGCSGQVRKTTGERDGLTEEVLIVTEDPSEATLFSAEEAREVSGLMEGRGWKPTMVPANDRVGN